MNILVTGASYGMGRAIACELAPISKLLLIHGRDLARLSETKRQVLALGAQACEEISQELADHVAAEAIESWVVQHTKELDALILNAGFYREGSLAEFQPEQYEQDFYATVHINLFLVQRLLPLLLAGKRKRIVIIGSTAAYEPYPLVPAYGVQKWALRGLAVNLRNEFRKIGVGVTFVAPGATWTGMWEGEDLPDDRLLEASDIAKLIAATLSLSPQAVVEELKVVPMLGDFHE
jgi:short-subunit dehydrogenase